MEDLIKRADAIEAYSDIYWIDDRLNIAFREELDKIDEKIRNIPTVEIAGRPQGEWIGYNADKEDWLRTDGTPIFLVCDKCYGTVVNNGSAHWNYCPNCGAKMKQ